LNLCLCRLCSSFCHDVFAFIYENFKIFLKWLFVEVTREWMLSMWRLWSHLETENLVLVFVGVKGNDLASVMWRRAEV
jgi:hypothetical protein